MATGITIKRYDGSTWVELAPKTTIAQVDGLQTALNGKQATLTFDNSPSQNSNNPVKSSGIYSAIQNVREIASGLCATYTTSLYKNTSNKWCLVFTDSNNTIQGDLVQNLNSMAHVEVTNGIQSVGVSTSNRYLVCILNTTPDTTPTYTFVKFVDLSTAKIGDNIYITDMNVPDFWFGGVVDGEYVFSVLETDKVALNDYETSSHASSTYLTKANGVTNVSWDSTNYKIQKTINGSTTDVVTLKKVASTGSYSDLTNKPTIPATNVIPSESTANKILLSTSTGGIAAWSSSAIGGAAYKGVTDNQSAADVTSSDQNLITGRTLYYQLAKKGYTTNQGTVTSVGITTTANNGLSVSGSVTTSGNLSVGFASNHSSVLYADSEPSNKVSGQILFEY